MKKSLTIFLEFAGSIFDFGEQDWYSSSSQWRWASTFLGLVTIHNRQNCKEIQRRHHKTYWDFHVQCCKLLPFTPFCMPKFSFFHNVGAFWAILTNAPLALKFLFIHYFCLSLNISVAWRFVHAFRPKMRLPIVYRLQAKCICKNWEETVSIQFGLLEYWRIQS